MQAAAALARMQGTANEGMVHTQGCHPRLGVLTQSSPFIDPLKHAFVLAMACH